jgi:hypothetical protein
MTGEEQQLRWRVIELVRVIERIMHISSAIVWKFGHASLIHIPALP